MLETNDVVIPFAQEEHNICYGHSPDFGEFLFEWRMRHTSTNGMSRDTFNVCQLVAIDGWVCTKTETNPLEWVGRKCTLPAIVRNTFILRSFCFYFVFNAIYLTRGRTVSSGSIGSALSCVALAQRRRWYGSFSFYERREVPSNEKCALGIFIHLQLHDHRIQCNLQSIEIP